MSAVWKYFTVEVEGSYLALCFVYSSGISQGLNASASLSAAQLIKQASFLLKQFMHTRESHGKTL